jgi:hypothetical protein
VKVIDYPKVSGCPQGQKLIDWGRTGPQGPAGPQGAQGPQGAAGTAGITKITLTRVFSPQETVVAPGSGVNAQVDCPAGKVAGGGFFANLVNSESQVEVTQSYALDSDSWVARGHNDGTIAWNLQAFAICMTTDPGTVIATASKGFKVAKKKGR